MQTKHVDIHPLPIELDRLDHLVLTVADIDVTARFYGRVLGMKKVTFKGDRVALEFGQQKINLHQSGCEFEPRAGRCSQVVRIYALSPLLHWSR